MMQEEIGDAAIAATSTKPESVAETLMKIYKPAPIAMDPHMKLQLLPGFNRQEKMLLCRPRIGVSFTNASTFLIVMADCSNCSTCGIEETTKHLQCDCPTYEDESSSLPTALGHLDGRPHTVEKILSPWLCASAMCKATKALLRFLKCNSLCDRL